MSDQRFVVEGVQHAIEGESWVRNIRVPSKSGTAVTLASPVMYAYKNGTDYTSTYFTGSMSVSGDIITTKTAQALTGGDRLFLSIFATVNGLTNQLVCRIILEVGWKGE